MLGRDGGLFRFDPLAWDNILKLQRGDDRDLWGLLFSDVENAPILH